ncbi:MAG: hypothetical protein OHK93_002280 [Ramalina farinacea]|uniref:Uncharacterized protein n=1 Tax=Ramalina farinacea TaxID=258253 RepID=A0AA43QT34_9LECA|nr:hypothetical protein [Ramalina farinacea]
MSQGRSPSGVASLRARFESNSSDKTPPGSRGRSPAGSVASDTSRPLSKVRTSFVAVEPSGHMASTLEVPKTGPATFDGSQDPKPEAVTNPISKPPKANGLPSTTDINGQQGSSEIPPAAEFKPEKGDADEEAIPTKSREEGLGSILKGSPFEGELGNEDTAQQARAEHSDPALQASKQSPALTSTDPLASKQGSDETKPTTKPSDTSRPTSRSTQKPTISSGSSTKATMNGKTKETADPKTASKKAPAAIRTQDAPHGQGKAAKAPSKDDGASKGSVKTPSTPHTPISSTSTAPKASSQPAKPLKASAAPSAKPSQGHSTQSKGPVKSSVDRVTSKVAETAKAATRPPTSKPASSHSAPNKPHAAATKPRPKSPTKPVKLPAAATAPTASSAAKHDEGVAPPQARSPGRQSSVSTATKGRAGSLSKPTRPVRASLPAHSKPAEKSKPKPRTSMASTGASSGSFLERMMRPTQSSAQKTHDKVEPKSPPRKVSAAKPKRKSEETDATKSDDRELEQTPAQQPDPENTDHHHETPESANAHPDPLTDPTTAKSDEVAKEIESTAPAASTTEAEEPQKVDAAH